MKLVHENISRSILCLWFRASLIYINNCPTRCNTKQSIYYSPSSLYMFRVSNTRMIRSTKNCNYSLRYCAATSLQRVQANLTTIEVGRCTKNMTSTGGCSYSFVYSWWWVWLTPETSRVNLQNNKYTSLCCIPLNNYQYISRSISTTHYLERIEDINILLKRNRKDISNPQLPRNSFTLAKSGFRPARVSLNLLRRKWKDKVKYCVMDLLIKYWIVS